MFDLKSVPLPSYSRREDAVNSATHAVGVPLCILGLVLLLRLQLGKVGGLQIFSTVLYIGSTLLVFLGSAIYHGMRPCFAKQVARVLDHCNVYIIIAGNNTSFFLTHVYPDKPRFALWMTAGMWALSAVGMLLTFMDLKRFNVPQIFTYVLLGWIAIFGMRSVFSAGENGRNFITMVILGGIFITVGAMIYLVGKKVPYLHAVFHLFVLAGSVVIFIGTYQFNLSTL